MVYRLIAPAWLLEKSPGTKKVREGEFTPKEIKKYNQEGYNIYFRPNHPSDYKGGTVDGSHIDVFEYVFVDYDLKSGTYESKLEFIEVISSLEDLIPTRIVDSGNGIHSYWKVSDLDAKSFLKLSRRLMRLFNTDDAVQTISQLMRLPGTLNTKKQGELIPCETLYEDLNTVYTCEQLDQILPALTPEDDLYCNQHYDKIYNMDKINLDIKDKISPKFGKLLRQHPEAKEIWSGNTSDRSKDDYRLGHIMFANGFTKEEAASVLVNSAKALSRAPVHRVSYATNIIDKIWTFETEGEDAVSASPTVREILSRGEETIKGIRFPCDRLIDDTKHGFRLGQVIGIIGGSGVGKTTLTLNCFLWFAKHNPDYQHFFFSLEQPEGEIAARIKTICGDNDTLYDKIHIVSNHDNSGEFKNLSMSKIEEHVKDYEQISGKKVGAIVIDHIGVLAKESKNGENEGLIGICREMKAVARSLNVMLIMLSQAPREKAGVGDIELDKSSAYGTVFFESFVDYCICLWQPLKRVYTQGAPTVMALKFAKIRHKHQTEDRIKEDICYQLFFDPNTERLRELTQDEETSAKYWQGNAATARKRDKKTDLVPYESRRTDAKISSSDDGTEVRKTNGPRSTH